MDTQRLLLFVGLSLVLFLLWEAWQREVNPPPALPVVTEQTSASKAQADVPVGAESRPVSTTPGPGARQ